VQFSKVTYNLYAVDQVDKNLYVFDLSILKKKNTKSKEIKGTLIMGPTIINAYKVIEDAKDKIDKIIISYTVH
jgi:hypothetical protein